MEDIYYKCPTEVGFVDSVLVKIGKILSEHNYKRTFLVYGGHHLEKSGELDAVTHSLKENGIAYYKKGGISPNPDISFIYDSLKEIRDFRPDCILAIGGGSVLDTAKNLAAAYYYDGDSLDFNKKTAKPIKSLPLVTIITIAAAGSEMSDSCVISDYKTGFKSGFNDVHNRPALSLEDPSLTYSVPLNQTCYGLVDIISHSFERYFSPSRPYEPSDNLALAVIASIVSITPVLLKDLTDKDARRAMMIDSTLSHNGWTNFGKKMRFPIHAIEHQMSGKHPDIPHGLGLRFLLGRFMEANEALYKDKIAVFGRKVFGLAEDSSSLSIQAFNDYLDSLPINKTMEELGISPAEEEGYIKQLKMKD